MNLEILSFPVAFAFAVALGALLPWFSTTVVALVRGRISTCPKCRSTRTYPVWPRNLERSLPIFVMPYCCEECRNRFYTGQSIDYTSRESQRPV